MRAASKGSATSRATHQPVSSPLAMFGDCDYRQDKHDHAEAAQLRGEEPLGPSRALLADLGHRLIHDWIMPPDRSRQTRRANEAVPVAGASAFAAVAARSQRWADVRAALLRAFLVVPVMPCLFRHRQQLPPVARRGIPEGQEEKPAHKHAEYGHGPKNAHRAQRPGDLRNH